MAIFGSLTTVRQQTSHLAWLQPAYVYLDELFTTGSPPNEKINSLAPGETFRRDLTGGTFALEQAVMTKARTEGFLETHRKYVDVQVVFLGEEIMELADAASLTVRDEYSVERDAMFYKPGAPVSVLRFSPRDTVIYFPEDAHKSVLHLAESRLVRKVVLKVPVPK